MVIVQGDYFGHKNERSYGIANVTLKGLVATKRPKIYVKICIETLRVANDTNKVVMKQCQDFMSIEQMTRHSFKCKTPAVFKACH